MRDVETLKPFTRFLMTIGTLPSSYLVSMTYEEQLLWFCNFLQKEVIPTVNNNAEAVIELQNYVSSYFDNLDVQEEINNKLDEMAESGTLEEIISEYLNSTAVFGFDSVADMKSATNLINGSYAKTLGYYSVNDDGGATYKIRTITNDDIVDEGSIIALNDNTLVAELVEKDINVKMFGAKGNDTQDDSQYFINAITFLNKENTLYIPNGTYIISQTITIPDSISLKGLNSIPTIKYTGTGTCIIINGHSDTHDNNIGSEYANADDKAIIENLNIYHPVDTTYTTDNAIAISCEDTSTQYLSRSTITKNVTITLFDIGIKFAENNFYINKFINTKLTRNKTAVFCPQTVVNSGENIVFDNCLFGMNEICCNAGAQWFMTFEGCSLDFNKCLFYQTAANAITTYRKITLSNCHIENNTDNYDMTGTIHGIIYNATGFFTFSNTVFFLTFKEDYFIKDDNTNYTDVSITNCKMHFLPTNFNTAYKTLDHDYLCNKYFKLHQENNSYTELGIPGSEAKIVNYAPYLTSVNQISNGTCTIDSTTRCLKSSNNTNTHLVILGSSDVNIASIKINAAPSGRDYMPIEFVTEDTSIESSVQLRDEFKTLMDSTEEYCKYIITENCSKVEVKFQFYDQSGTYIYGDDFYTLPSDNNVPSDTICRWCYPNPQYKNRFRKQIAYIQMVVRLTGIVGKNMKLHAQIMYTR